MGRQSDNVVEEHPGGLAPVIDRNIRALLERRQRMERHRSWQDRMADAVARFTGSLPFVYIHLAVFSTWIVWNVGGLPVPAFDPSLVILAMAASVEAIFLSTFVLMNQNRMAALADHRADLDLQISLLAEHEITRIITLAAAIADRMGIDEARNPELSELSRDIAPDKVMDRIEQHQRDGAEGRTS